MEYKSISYLSAPAKSNSCPFRNRCLRLCLQVFDYSRDLLDGVAEVSGTLEVGAEGLLLFWCVGWEPGVFSVASL